MGKYIVQLSIVCVLLSILGCGRKWNNPVESAIPLPGSPQLLAPANNTWIWNTQDTIKFVWTIVDGATKYKLIVSMAQDLSAPAIEIETAETTYFSISLPPGKYYYTVKAWNPINVWKESSIQEFEKGPYLVGRNNTWPGELNSTNQIIFNDYFYYINGTAIYIYDISDFNNPNFIKMVTYSRNRWDQQVVLSGNLLYLLVAGDGLSIASLSDPLNPTEIGYVQNCAQIAEPRNYGIAIKDTIAYVINYWNGLFLINIKDPTNPTNISNCSIEHPSFKVAVLGNYAYIAREEYGLTIVDVTDPYVPFIASTQTYPNSIYSVYVYNGSLYTSYYKFSLSDPVNPAIISSSDYYGFYKMFIANELLFAGPYVYQDIGNNISILGKCEKLGGDTLLSTGGFDIKHNYMYCGALYYHYVGGGFTPLSYGFLIFKIAPFSVTE